MLTVASMFSPHGLLSIYGGTQLLLALLACPVLSKTSQVLLAIQTQNLTPLVFKTRNYGDSSSLGWLHGLSPVLACSSLPPEQFPVTMYAFLNLSDVASLHSTVRLVLQVF